MKINDRILTAPFPPDQEEERYRRNDGEYKDQVRFEPVLPLAMLEQRLARLEAFAKQVMEALIH